MKLDKKIMITLDEDTLKNLEALSKLLGIKNRSAVIRFLVNKESGNLYEVKRED